MLAHFFRLRTPKAIEVGGGGWLGWLSCVNLQAREVVPASGEALADDANHPLRLAARHATASLQPPKSYADV